jgi:very-short-patch-repair endonuclease
LATIPLLLRADGWLPYLPVGEAAVLSYRSTAALWGIRPSARARIDVTVPRQRRTPPGIQLHRDRFCPDELTAHDGIPVTTVARTLLDLAAVLPRREFERAVNEAEVLRLFDAKALERLVERYPRRRGAVAVRAVLERGRIGNVTRSELENLFLRFLDHASLPAPDLNHPMQLNCEWIEVDCVWHQQRVVVELDGHGTHGTRAAFERDRRRDRALQAEGWRVVRVTWRQITEEAELLAAELLAADLRALLVQPARDSGSSRSRKTPGSTLRAASAASSAS